MAPVAAVALGAGVVSILPFYVLGAVAVEVAADLGVETTTLGILFSTYFASAACLSVGAGRWIDRGDRRHITTVAVLVSTAVLFGIGAWANEAHHLLILMVIGGASNAVLQPALSRFIASSVRPRSLPVTFGIKMCSAPAASLIGGLLVALVVVSAGWRWAFLAMVPLGLIVAISSIAVGPSRSRQAPTSDGESRNSGGPRALGLLAAGSGLGAGAATCLGAFLVVGLVDAGWSLRSAGLLYAACGLLGVVARLLIGHGTDGDGARLIGRCGKVMLLGAAGFGLLATSSPAGAALGAVLAYAIGWSWPTLSSSAIAASYRGGVASAVGISQAAVYTGSVIGPLGFPVAAEQLSLSAAWIIAGLCACAGGLLMLRAQQVLLAQVNR